MPQNLANVSWPEGEPFRLEIAMDSNSGLVRENNEDSVVYCNRSAAEEPGQEPKDDEALAVVADGMGGHAAGEIASRITVESLVNAYSQMAGDVPAFLSAAFADANAAILRRADEEEACRGMGTTCTAAVIHKRHLFLGHIGDSRAYILRDGTLYQISMDHSLVGEMVRDNMLSPEEARVHPDRNVILRALGRTRDADPAIWREGLPLKRGDRILICSDGLTDLVNDHDIARVLKDGEPAAVCQSLIRAALDGGGLDNVSVGVLAVGSNGIDRKRAARETRPAAILSGTGGNT